MSYNLSSLKGDIQGLGFRDLGMSGLASKLLRGGYIGDCLEEHYGITNWDTRSLDYSSNRITTPTETIHGATIQPYNAMLFAGFSTLRNTPKP